MGSTGLSTQATIGKEASHGVVAAVLTRAFEIRSEGIEDAVERIESETLRAGKRLQSFWRPNRKGAEGDLEFELLNKGFAFVWEAIFGASTAAVTPGGATLAREISVQLGSMNGKSYSVQVGRPAVTGTVHPFTYLGGKVNEAELSLEVDELAVLTTTWDFQNGLTPSTPAAAGGPGPALAAPSYPTAGVPFDFIGAKIQVGGVDIDLTEVTMNVNNNLKTDRFFLRRSSLKKEQIEETEPRDITFEGNGEFEGLTAYNRFVNGTEAAITVSLRGDDIETGQPYEHLITGARVRFDGGTPTAEGADVLENGFEAKLLAPASGEALTVLTRSTDLTV